MDASRLTPLTERELVATRGGNPFLWSLLAGATVAVINDFDRLIDGFAEGYAWIRGD